MGDIMQPLLGINGRRHLSAGASFCAMTFMGVPLAQAQDPCADVPTGSICTVTVNDEGGPYSGSAGKFFVVVNNGEISGAPAISMGSALGFVVVNRENSTIDGDIVRNLPNSPFLMYTVLNSGTINGNVTFVEGNQANIFTHPTVRYFSDDGIVNGNVQLGGSGSSTALFLQLGDEHGVSGTISAGAGLDIYARSFKTSQSLILGDFTLPTSFEIAGYEAAGAETVLTLTGSGTTISLMGDGQVVNEGIINAVDTTSLYPAGFAPVPPSVGYQASDFATFLRPGMTAAQPMSVYSIGIGRTLASFTNDGTLNADVRIATKTFINNGAINMNTAAPSSVVHAGANADFIFNNSGIITMTHNGARLAASTPEGEFDSGLQAALRLRSAVDSSAAHNVNLLNSGSISGGLDVQMIADQFSFTNSGTLTGLIEGGVSNPSLKVAIGELYLSLPSAVSDEFNGQSAAFINSSTGNITHGAALDLAAFDVSFTNQGQITGVAAFDYVALKIEQDMLQEDNDTNYSGDNFTFTNSGTINGTVYAEPESTVATFSNSGDVIRPLSLNIQKYGAEYAAFEILSETIADQTLAFTNSGLIESQDRASSGLLIEVEAGEDGDDGPFTTASASVTVNNSGTIQATGGATRATLSTAETGLSNPIPMINVNAALAVDASDVTGTSTVTINNQAGGSIAVSGQLSQVSNAGYTSQGPEEEKFGSVAIIAQGHIINIRNDGLISGGVGSQFVPTAVFSTDILRGKYLAGAIHTLGVEDEEDIYTGSIDHIINGAHGEIYGSIDLGDNNDKLDNYGLITGDIFMGAGNDILTHSLLAEFYGIADGGAGDDLLLFDITGTSHFGEIDAALRAKFINFEITQLIGTANIVVDPDAPIVFDSGPITLDQGVIFDAPAGQTAFALAEGSGPVVVNATVNGNISLAGSDNSLIIGNSSTITGDIKGSAGDYNVGVTGTITGNIELGDGNNNVTNSGTITGAVTLGNGGNSLTHTGIITEGVNFGSGSDTLTLSGDWSIGGPVVGGAGQDEVAISFSSAPINESDVPVIDLSGFTEFETLTVDGGTGKVSNARFEDIAITNGRLIGAADGTISGHVTVGAGGTFGSAGLVDGDVTVKSGGTFSPGASPAIHYGEGNVTMEAGSILVFEFVPSSGQSDQIIQDGNYNIEAGALLDIRGNRPLTPGVAYDMIKATNLTGSEFTILSWDRSAVQGFLRYTPTALQLVGTFALQAPSTDQVNDSLDYVNSLLIDDEASSYLIDAIPSLLNDDGFADVSAFASLTPETYASAAQIGVDHGLAIIRASRSQRTLRGQSDGMLFSYAQFIGDWSRIKANGNGASRATNNSYGVMGGIGYGNENAAISAFVGYLDSKQRIDALDAKTKADGIFAGVQAQYQSDHIEISAMIARDWAKASSERSVLEDELSGKYNLNSFIIDASVGAKLPLSESWSIGPRAGISHISTKRGAVREAGSAAFALDVLAKRHKGSFVDAAIRLEGGQGEASASVQPWLEAGLRHQISGGASVATAGFIGSPATLTIVGADRKDTLFTTAVGMNAALSQAADIYGSYHGEFGNGGQNTINIGIRYRF